MYEVLESRLKESRYLAGDKFTIADIANFTWVRGGAQLFETDLSEYPALKKWRDEIQQRPAVQKGLKIPDSGRTDEEFAEFFRAGRARILALDNEDKH